MNQPLQQLLEEYKELLNEEEAVKNKNRSFVMIDFITLISIYLF
jgi:hypothetical protein